MNSGNMKDFNLFKEEFTENLLAKKPSTKLRRWQKQGLLKKHISPLDRCAHINQDHKYHKDTVFEHCIKTCDNTPAVLEMRWAGLLHDIGKAATYGEHILCNLHAPQKVILDKCPQDGKRCRKKCKHAVPRITFYRHEVESERLARQILNRFKVEKDQKRRILNLIGMHMYNFTREWGDRALGRFILNTGLTKEDLENPDAFPLFRLRIADRISRGLEPVTQRQRDFEVRLLNYLYDKSK